MLKRSRPSGELAIVVVHSLGVILDIETRLLTSGRGFDGGSNRLIDRLVIREGRKRRIRRYIATLGFGLAPIDAGTISRSILLPGRRRLEGAGDRFVIGVVLWLPGRRGLVPIGANAPLLRGCVVIVCREAGEVRFVCR